jgi:hypothetical protein
MEPFLTEEELTKLATYKHSADKTTLEKLYVEKLLVPIEKNLFPARWSANTITLMGQMPIFLYVLYLWAT